MGQPAVKVGSADTTKKRSGLRKLASGEVLFTDGEKAESLFIIQSGQIRLFKPKGKGFIEIAVLRTGEVLGEMAYFDDESGGGVRSCSAEAIGDSEIIEVSFAAFEKTMEGLNPWFKTIVNTLATRLRKTNGKLRELESNNVSSYGATGGYKFFRNIDVIRSLSVIFLALKSHGESLPEDKQELRLHLNTMNLYAVEIFGLQESKFESFIQLLIELKLLSLKPDKDNLPKILCTRDLTRLRALLLFFNTQRVLPEEKQLSVSQKCQLFLERILQQLESVPESQKTADANITKILEDFKTEKIPVGADDLLEGIKYNFCAELTVDGGVVSTKVQIDNLRKQYPAIQMMNALSKVNDGYESGKYKG